MSRTPTQQGLQVEWPTEPAGPPPSRPGPFAFLKELPALIVIAFGVALLLKTLLIQAFYIPSESMEPTLLVNDRILVNKFAYRFREPVRGEVIVFIAEKDRRPKSTLKKITSFLFEGLGVSTPEGERDFVKRIIGLPGDTITVSPKGVYIKPPKGKRMKLSEPYIYDARSQGPPQSSFKVPKDMYFVMGDNRANSSDSRSSLGPIKRSDIIGKAFVRIWPPRRLGVLGVPTYEQPKPSTSPKPSSKPASTKKKRSAPAGVPMLPAPSVAALAVAGSVRRRR